MSALRIVADWLKHPEYGVNTLLPSIPRGIGEAPASPVTVVDELREGWVARMHLHGEVAKGGPFLAVALAPEGNEYDAAVDRGGEPAVHNGSASLVLLYVARESQSERGTRHAHEVLRAARVSLTLLFDPQTPASARTKNGVTLGPSTGYKLLALHEERGDALITGGLLVSYTTHEAVPVILPEEG